MAKIGAKQPLLGHRRKDRIPPVADAPRSCEPAEMKPWIATVMMAILSTGCTGHQVRTGAPQAVREAASIAPSSEEVEDSYRALLRRLTCRGAASCDLP